MASLTVEGSRVFMQSVQRGIKMKSMRRTWRVHAGIDMTFTADLWAGRLACGFKVGMTPEAFRVIEILDRLTGKPIPIFKGKLNPRALFGPGFMAHQTVGSPLLVCHMLLMRKSDCRTFSLPKGIKSIKNDEIFASFRQLLIAGIRQPHPHTQQN
nr:hypothetical protein [Desulfoluna sp.]